MPSDNFGNVVLNKDQIAKLAINNKDPRLDTGDVSDFKDIDRTDTRGLTRREMSDLREEQTIKYEDNFKQAHDIALKFISQLQKLLKQLSTKTAAKNIKEVASQATNAINIILNALLTVGDNKTYAKLEFILKLLSKVLTKFEAGEFDKLSAVREKFNVIYQKSLKLRLDEDLSEDTDSGIQLHDLKPVTFHSKSVASTVIAPLTIILKNRLPARTLKAFKSMHFEQVHGTFSTLHGQFLIISKDALTSDRRLTYQTLASMLVAKANTHSSERLTVIFDVHLQAHNWYAVWLIPEQFSTAISDILDIISSYKIYIK